MYNREIYKKLSCAKLPVTEVSATRLLPHNIYLDILRLDQLHPIISGNKWFKLKHHLEYAFGHGYSHVLSFGGAWSNHIHALAAAGHILGFPTVGVIRGERAKQLSPTLQDVESWGMQLHFISRHDYRNKHTPEFQEELLSELGLSPKGVWVVPEGGSGELGAIGCESILSAGNIGRDEYNQIWLAAGTGATSAGVIRSVSGSETDVHCVSVLKGADWLNQDIQSYLENQQRRWKVELDYHCGGYARTTPELMSFMSSFEQETGVPLEPVYTGKALYGLFQSVKAGKVESGSRILFIHTGGLQGKREL